MGAMVPIPLGRLGLESRLAVYVSVMALFGGTPTAAQAVVPPQVAPPQVATGAGPARRPGLRVERREDRVRVLRGDLLLTEYRFQSRSRPVLFPVVGLDGVERTRSWPVGDARPGEAKDHPHHRSCWFGHGEVNGYDFWAEGEGRGRVRHVQLDRAEVDGDGVAHIVAQNEWIGAGDRPVLTDRRRWSFRITDDGLAIDLDISLHAKHGPLVFGDTKEGTMALRLHPALRLRGEVATGEAQNSEGVTGRGVWGKRARWVDYRGTIAGRAVGVAMFDHPDNHAHPTWWHARDYGLVAANPFGVHHFERKPRGTGDLRIADGGVLRCRYRILLHPAGGTNQHRTCLAGVRRRGA